MKRVLTVSAKICLVAACLAAAGLTVAQTKPVAPASRIADAASALTVPAGGSTNLAIQSVPGGTTAPPSQSGLLLMYRDGALNKETDRIFVTP